MKHLLGLAAAAALVMGGTQAHAVDMPPLAQKSGCTACHAVGRKVVGPDWAEVAKKYKGDAGAKAALVDKVKKGGKGTWGQVPMPPYSPRVADADIESLVDFILGL